MFRVDAIGVNPFSKKSAETAGSVANLGETSGAPAKQSKAPQVAMFQGANLGINNSVGGASFEMAA